MSKTKCICIKGFVLNDACIMQGDIVEVIDFNNFEKEIRYPVVKIIEGICQELEISIHIAIFAVNFSILKN